MRYKNATLVTAPKIRNTGDSECLLSDDVTTGTTFLIGYFEGRQSTKHWIYTEEDLKAMYGRCGIEIMLWCDGQSGDESLSAKHQKIDGFVTKREEKEQKVEELAKELKERNEVSMELSDHLWARMIITGVHSDKDTPPQIPIITGITPKRKQKTNERSDLQEAIISTAAAVVKAVPHSFNHLPFNRQFKIPRHFMLVIVNLLNMAS